MKTRRRQLWRVFVCLTFALSLHAQSDLGDKAPRNSNFVTANGVRLHHLDWGGKGDTLLFPHGMGGSAHTFDHFASRFTNQLRVLGLTQRGHGESDTPATGYDTLTLVEDVR
jgi:pimeloyl-ACP methyl ester carboxylesterase